MATTQNKVTADWFRIEADYRAGIKPLRAIAGEHTITEGAIRKRAKKEDWQRDLSAKARPSEKVVLRPEADEFDTSGYIYVIYLDAPERYYKIGMAKQFNSRFDQHQCASPFDLCVACAFFVPNMRVSERDLHYTFAAKRVRGEWFQLDVEDLNEISKRALLV